MPSKKKQVPAVTEMSPAIPKSFTEMFSSAATFVLPEGATIRAMSPMLAPKDFPTGKVLIGRFAKMFVTNPTKDKQGVGVEIVPDGAHVGVALAAVATLAQGLEIVGWTPETAANAQSKNLGRLVAIQRMPDKLPSKKGQDAWHFVVAILPEPGTKALNAPVK